MRLFQNFGFERAASKKVVLQPLGRKTARASAKPTVFCRKLVLYSLLVYNRLWSLMENAARLNDSGIALTEANRPNEAIPLFQQALSLEPENPLLWLNLGIALQKTGEYGEALESFQRAVYIDDYLADAWGSMGLIYYELEQFNFAEECYHAAIARDSSLPNIWNNLGVLYFSEGSYEEARYCFEEAVSLLPVFYDALINIRDTCRELEDYPAAAEFERILSGLTPKERGYTSR
jgi:tetratricopeptide (TPR) repeat protein